MKQSISRQFHARGFSLIELMIVIAVLGIIVAIAVPNLISARQAAKSASVVSALRLIHSSEISYRASNDRYGDLNALGAAGLINDSRLANGQKAKYTFTVTPDAATPAASYTATASPSDPSMTAVWRHYYSDQSGVIRWRSGAVADASSQVID